MRFWNGGSSRGLERKCRLHSYIIHSTSALNLYEIEYHVIQTQIHKIVILLNTKLHNLSFEKLTDTHTNMH